MQSGRHSAKHEYVTYLVRPHPENRNKFLDSALVSALVSARSGSGGETPGIRRVGVNGGRREAPTGISMQWLLFTLSYVMLVTARTSREDSQHFGLEDLQDLQDNQESREWNHKFQDEGRGLYDVLNRLEEGVDTSEPKPTNKRALSVLSRWRPFGSLGLRMNSVHKVPSRAPMMSMFPELDFVSAETRGIFRPVGQPLRWGRKR